jgi:hypothetical protein
MLLSTYKSTWCQNTDYHHPHNHENLKCLLKVCWGTQNRYIVFCTCLYSGSPVFKSWPKVQISWHVFQSLQAKHYSYAFKTGNDCFHSLPPVYHLQWSFHSKLCNLWFWKSICQWSKISVISSYISEFIICYYPIIFFSLYSLYFVSVNKRNRDMNMK